jgi:hypothetical protein
MNQDSSQKLLFCQRFQWLIAEAPSAGMNDSTAQNHTKNRQLPAIADPGSEQKICVSLAVNSGVPGDE